MTHCLVIGLSSFARRRVIPALLDCASITSVHVASRHAGEGDLDDLPGATLAGNAEQALSRLGSGLVYVSLDNAGHEPAVERALVAGNHVIVDKPSFTSLEAAERLVEFAQSKGLVLAEATTYGFHPVIDAMRQQFVDRGCEPTHATAVFTPPVPASGYRFDRALGGGALLDLGPYAVSVGRLLWRAPPRSVAARVTSLSADGQVDTSFSALIDHGGGRVVVGHFGFTTEYTNELHLLGSGLSVRASRVFSTPPDYTTEVSIRHRNHDSTVSVGPSSSMAGFLDVVLGAVAAGDTASLADDLLADARALDSLRTAALTADADATD